VAGVAEIQSESSTIVRQWESGGGVSFPDGDNRLGINECSRSERGLHFDSCQTPDHHKLREGYRKK
jgi:hypothetical protein